MPLRPNQRALLRRGRRPRQPLPPSPSSQGFSYTRISRVGEDVTRRTVAMTTWSPFEANDAMSTYQRQAIHIRRAPHYWNSVLARDGRIQGWHREYWSLGFPLSTSTTTESCHQTAKLWELHLSCTNEEGRNSRWRPDSNSTTSLVPTWLWMWPRD